MLDDTPRVCPPPQRGPGGLECRAPAVVRITCRRYPPLRQLQWLSTTHPIPLKVTAPQPVSSRLRSAAVVPRDAAPITSHGKRIGISHLDAPPANQTDLAFNPIRHPRRHHTRPSAVMCGRSAASHQSPSSHRRGSRFSRNPQPARLTVRTFCGASDLLVDNRRSVGLIVL